MRLRLAAMALVAAAAGLSFGVTIPARQEAAQAGEAYRRARDARRDTTRRLAMAARRDATWRRFAVMPAGAPAGIGDTVTRLRRDVLEAVHASAVSGVRLAVRPGRPPVGATLALSAAGSLQQTTRLVDDLTRARGVVLDRVRLAPAGAGVTVQVQGMRLVGAP